MRNSTGLLRAMAAIAIFALLIQASPFAKATEVEANTNAPVLHTQTFKIEGNPNAFYSGLMRANNIREKNQPQAGSSSNGGFSVLPGRSAAELQSAFTGFFKAIGVNLAPPKSVFFSDLKGTLTVYATDEDLELIKLAIDTFTNIPPEVQITVRAYELRDEAFFNFQLEWLAKLDANKGEGLGWMAGILTETGFKAVLKSVEAKHSKDFLNKGEVTTLSGILANFFPGKPVGEMKTNIGPVINYSYDDSYHPVELDVVPQVEKDGATIQMSLISIAMETNGDYVSSNSVMVLVDSKDSNTKSSQLVRAHVHQLTTGCTVWDGQTAVLVLKPPYAEQGKFLVVFVTSVIVDPSGDRKNLPESLPFAEKAVPEQTGR